MSEDDWGTLDFNPTFIGEYKVFNLEFMMKQSEFEKEVFIPSPLSKELKSNFMAASVNEMIEMIKLDFSDIVMYAAPWTPSEMDDWYGSGYLLLKKLGFNGQGCGKYEQGIQVPLDNEIYDHTYGLGFNPYKQPSNFPLNVNHICGG